jgi:sugar/nucleoside kinase (ribokinase family)
VSRIALVGNLTVDRVAGGPPRPGGGVYWAARAAAHVGADAVVVTRCAPGDRDVALAPLEAFGLPVISVDAAETTAFSFHYEGDHRVMNVDAVGDDWSTEDIDGWAAPALADAEWVLVAGLLRSHFRTETIEALARDGHRLLLDAQGSLRRAETGPLQRDDEIDRSTFAHLTVLKVNEEEGRVLAGSLEIEPLRALGVGEVILTLGSKGARVIDGDTVADIPPSPTRGAVDPTGAGDSFSVVYLDGRARGLNPVDAARRASETVADLISRG